MKNQLPPPISHGRGALHKRLLREGAPVVVPLIWLLAGPIVFLVIVVFAGTPLSKQVPAVAFLGWPDV
jgi:hypothetical protein